MSTYLSESSRCVRLSMTTNNKLTDHTWYAQKEHTTNVNHDKHGTSILSCHVRKSPYITQSHSRTCCGKNDAKLTSKTCSFQFSHLFLPHNLTAKIRKK